jgi:hypothetical protein
MLIGNVGGVAVPPLLVASDASGRIKGLRRFMLGQLAGSAALLLLCCLYRQRPPTPPSASAKESLQVWWGGVCGPAEGGEAWSLYSSRVGRNARTPAA